MTPALRDFMIRDIGCVVARLRGLEYVPCTKHHLLTTGMHGNGKRRGEAFTVGLNDWSHQGIPILGMTAEQCREVFGPSYHHHARAFRALYPDALLLEEQERLLKQWKEGNL